MKRSGFLIKLFVTLSALVLTSCDLSNIVPNVPRRRSSKEEDDISEIATSEDKSSAKGSKSTSSKHTHYAADNAVWYFDDNYHWHKCAEDDGYTVERGTHEFVQIVTVEPTCTEDGHCRFKCAVCGFEKEQQVAAFGHDWQQVPIGQDINYLAPTTESDGRMTEKCSICGAEQMVSIPKLVPSFKVGTVDIENDNSTGKVDIIFYGTQENYSFNDFKIAFGLKDRYGNFVVGSLEPQDSDYSYAPIMSDDATGLFYTVIHLSEIAATGVLNTGAYEFYAGPKGCYGPAYIDSLSGSVRNDDYFTYNFTSNYDYQNNKMALVLNCEKITKHFHLTDAVIETKNNDNEVWLKIFGLSYRDQTSVSRLQSFLNTLNPHVDFQIIGNNWAITKLSSDNFYYEVKQENGQFMVYFNINISFMLNTNAKYITHINFLEDVQTDCKMEEDFAHSFVIANGNKVIEVISHPDCTDQANFWGCLGIIMTSY